MDKLKYPTIVIILIMVLSLTGLSMKVSARPLAATSPTLTGALSYSVVGGLSITNTGSTFISGNVGVSPAGATTGFGTVTFGSGSLVHNGDSSAAAATADLAAAYTNLNGQGCTTSYAGAFQDLVGLSLTPGVYCATEFRLSGDLTLVGNTGDVWIFKSAGAINITSGSPGVHPRVLGGDPCNLWWTAVSTTTIGTYAEFRGNVLSDTSSVVQTGATLNGLVYGRTAGVTLDTNTISAPICAAQLTQTAVAATLTAVRTNTATRTPTNTATRTPTSTPTSTPRPGVLPGTGFSPNGVTVLSNQSADKAYAAMGDLWLEVPKLGVQMNIVGVPETGGTWDVSWLGKQAGWLNGSAFPTWAGNSVLTGHVWNADNTVGPFRYINTLWWGDKVIVHAWGAKYVYEVRSVIQVGPGNTTAMMKHETLPWITLVTCRGYDQASDSYKYRVLVRAVLIEVK